jgi:hypothetical protein
MIRRRLAMRIAFVNRPEGRGYVTAFGDLMKRDGFDIKDKTLMTSLTAVLWLHDDAERLNMLREIRDTMTPGKRSRLNSPIAARQHVEKVLKARQSGTEETLKTSPLAMARKTIADQARDIATLQSHIQELEADRDQGSLFDLKRDSADDIGKVIVGNVGSSKARKIRDAILAALNAAKPAG